MRTIRSIVVLVGFFLVLTMAHPTEAGDWWRPRQPARRYAGPVYVVPVRPQSHGFRLFAPPRDAPTPTNGWGYGLPAAGYGSSYPAHPEGPGWSNRR